MKDYILFCAQEAGFQTRCMLIPCDNLELVRDCEVLRKHSKPTKLDILGHEYNIDNLVIDQLVPATNYGYQSKDVELGNIVAKLSNIANGYGDDEFYNSVKTHLNAGFHHVKNYVRLRNLKQWRKTPINIVEGFLVLQTTKNRYYWEKYSLN